MSENSIAERVKKIIVEHIGVDESLVHLNAKINDDLGRDELDSVELVIALEEEFNCTIPDDDFVTFHTVKDIIDFIEEHL